MISGLKLTYSGGHTGDRTFLTGTNTRSPGTKLRVSCDQELAAAVGRPPGFPRWPWGSSAAPASAATTIKPCPGARAARRFRRRIVRTCCSISCSAPTTAETLDRREAEFLRRASVLDSLRGQARRLNRSLGSGRPAQARRISDRHPRSRTPHAG